MRVQSALAETHLHQDVPRYANQRDQEQKNKRNKHKTSSFSFFSAVRVHYLEGSGLTDCVKSFSQALFFFCQPVLIVGAQKKQSQPDSFVV